MEKAKRVQVDQAEKDRVLCLTKAFDKEDDAQIVDGLGKGIYDRTQRLRFLYFYEDAERAAWDGQEESKVHVRRGSSNSLASPGSTGCEYDASVEGSAGEVLTPSSRPRGASVSPCSTRSSSFDDIDSAETETCLRSTPLVDYIVPTWKSLAPTGPSSVDTGYAASAGGRTRSSSEGSTSRSSEASPPKPVGVPSRGVIPSTTTKLTAYLGLSKSSSESDLRKPQWSVALSSVGTLSRSRSESSVNRVVACPLKPADSAAPSVFPGHLGTSYRLLSAGASVSDGDGSVYNATRRSHVSLADSTKSSCHTSVSDNPASAEMSSTLPQSSRPSHSRAWKPPEWEPGDISSSGPKGANSVGPPMPESKRGTVSLDSRRTPYCPDFARTMVEQAPLDGSGSFGRRHSRPLGSLASSSDTPRAPLVGKGCKTTANKSTTENISLDERPPFSGSSLAGSPPASGHSDYSSRNLLSPDVSSSLGADAFNNERASSLTQSPRETSLILSGVEDFNHRLLSAGVASTRSADRLETERLSQAWISAASSPASCHGRRSLGRDGASWDLYSSCGGGGSPHSRPRVSFGLPVSATPWVCLSDHDELPSSVKSSSPIGCKIVCPSHQGQAVDKPPRLAQENRLPGHGPTRSTIVIEGGKGLCSEATPLPPLKQGVTDTVSTPWEDSPSPDAGRSPGLEQDITDIASTPREDFPSHAEHRWVELVSRSVDLAAPSSTSECQVLGGGVLTSRSEATPRAPLTGNCSVVATLDNNGIESAGALSSSPSSVAGVSESVVSSPRVRSREESGRGLRPASGSSNQARRILLPLESSPSLGADAFGNGRTSFLTQPPCETSLSLSGMEDFTLGLLSAGAASTRNADRLETERFSQAWISAASSPVSCHRRRNSGRDGASRGSVSPYGGGGSPHGSPHVSFSLSVSATPWRCFANHDELPSSKRSSSPTGSTLICASNGRETNKPSRLVVQESTLPDDGRARQVIEPARSTIGNEEEKCHRPGIERSPRLEQGVTDMVSMPHECLPSSPDAVRSPVLKQDSTNVVTKPPKGFSLPAKFMRVERKGRSVELEAPPFTAEVEIIHDGVLTLRSYDPPGGALTDGCSVVATPDNSESESAGVLSSTSCSVAEVIDNEASSPRVRSREEGGRSLRFGDSPSLSQHGSSNSSWSLTKYVASGKANASHDDSDSSWSLTKNIASGKIVVAAGKTSGVGSSASSDLSYRVTLEHGPHPSIEDSGGSPGGLDACSAPTPALQIVDCATKGRSDRRMPASPLPSGLHSGSSDGMGSTPGQDTGSRGRSGKIAGASPRVGSSIQESTREMIHVTTRATSNIARATPTSARNTPTCSRLISGYPPSVRERRTTPQRETSSSIRRSSSKEGCSDISMRQQRGPSSSTRQSSSSSYGRDARGSTKPTNVIPSTDEAGKKTTTRVSKASRGRMGRNSSASLRSSSTPNVRKKETEDKGSNGGTQSGGIPPAISSCGVKRPSGTARSKSISTVQNRTPTLTAVPLRLSQSHAPSVVSSSTTSGRFRVDGQRSGEPTKYTSVLRASPAKSDLAIRSSSQRSNRIPTEAGTSPRPSDVQRSSRASRLASCASADEPRSGDISKSKSVPRRSSIEVKSTKTSRSRSLAIQGRLAAAAAPSTHTRVRAHRSSCPSSSTSAVGTLSDETNRLRKSTGQSRSVAPSQRSANNASQTPALPSSARASTAGSVAVVSPEPARTSTCGRSRSGVDGGGRRWREKNTPYCSAGRGSANVPENSGERSAGNTRKSSKPPRRRTTTPNESKGQEGRSRSDSACGSGESIGGGGDGRTKNQGHVKFSNSSSKCVNVGNEDAAGEISSISSDHQTSSSAAEHSDADEDSAAASAPSIPPSWASDPASDRTPGREVTAIDAPYAKLARLRAENERNGRTHDKLKLELLPRLKRMMKEWKPGVHPNPHFNKKNSVGGEQPCSDVLETKNDAQPADLKERLQHIEKARAADSTAFKTHMTETHTLLAFSEAAGAEEQKSSAQRTSSSNAKTDHAISGLVPANTSWADERQKMTTIMMGLKQDAVECKQHLVSEEKATGRRQAASDERASAAESKTAVLEANDVYPKHSLTEPRRAEHTSLFGESRAAKESHEALIRIRSVLTEKVELAVQSEAALTECKECLVSAETKAAGLEVNIVCLEDDLEEAKSVGQASLAREVTLQQKVAGLRDRLAQKMALEVDREAAFTECKESLVSAENAMATQQVAADERASVAQTKTTGLEENDVCPKEVLTESKRAEHTSRFGGSKVKEAHEALIRIRSVLTEKIELADQREAALTECKERLVSAEETMAMQQVKAEERASTAATKVAGMEANIVCLEEDLTEYKRAEKTLLAHEVTLQKKVAGLRGLLAEKMVLAIDREVAFSGCKERLASAEETMAMQQVEADERTLTAETKAAGMKANIACLEENLVESKRAENTSLSRESTLHKEIVRLQDVIAEHTALGEHREAALTECNERLVSAEESMVMHQVAAGKRESAEIKAAGFEANMVFLEQELAESKRAEHACLTRESTLHQEVAGLQDVLAQKSASELCRDTAFTECKERLASAEETVAMQQVEVDERALTVETKVAGLEASIGRLKSDLTESKRAERVHLARESTLHQEVVGLQDGLAQKSALEVGRDTAFTECKQRLVSAEETMAMQQVEADERALTVETKVAGLEASIAHLNSNLTESKRAEHAHLTRESTLHNKVVGLLDVLAQKAALEVGRNAAITKCKERLISNKETMAVQQVEADERALTVEVKVTGLEESITHLKNDLTESKRVEHAHVARESTLHQEVVGLQHVLAQKSVLEVGRDTAFTECKERLVSAEETMAMQSVEADERALTVETKVAGLEASITYLKSDLTESKRAEHAHLTRESTLHKEVVRLQDVLAQKRALEVNREASFTECKERLVLAEESEVMYQVASGERESAELKAAGLEANIAFLEQELTESKRAEDASLARESTLQTDMAGLHAEKRVLETERAAAFTRERGLQEEANDANAHLVAERGARDAERTKSLECHGKLEKEASASKLRELSALNATRAMKEQTETKAFAEKAAVSELETSLVKSRRALLSEQVAASARSLTVEKEHAFHLREVRERLMRCEAAKKDEQKKAAWTRSISEEKVRKTTEQLVVAEDALCAKRNEMTARFATLQRESDDNFEKRETSAERKMKAVEAVAHQREARSEAEIVSMTERLAVAEGRSSSEHAENARLSSRLQALGQETGILTQRLVEAEEALEMQRTKTTEDLRVVHEELGKLQTSAEKENKQNTAIVAHFTERERVQSGKLEMLTFEAVRLAKERDTANGLLKDQNIARTKERTTAARENASLNKILNDLGRLELAEQRSLQVDRSATPGCGSTVTIDEDHGRRGTATGLAESTSQFEVRSTSLGNSTVRNHVMAPQRSSASCRQMAHTEQVLPPDKHVCNTKQDSVIEEESSLPTGAGYEPFRGTRPARTRHEAPPVTVSSVRTIDAGTTSAENHAMTTQQSSTPRRETIYPEQDFSPDKHVRNTKQDPAIKEASRLATDAEYEPFQGTSSACARGESSPATILAARSADLGSRAVRDSAMASLRSSASCFERTSLDRGLLPDEYSCSAKEAPATKEKLELATGAKYEPFQGARSACARAGSFSTNISSVTSTSTGTRSVENQAMVSQQSSASHRELIHLELSLLPERFTGNTEQVPTIKDEAGLTTAYTRDELSSANISSMRSTDLGTRSAGNHRMPPQPSSATRRERMYRYPNQNLLPAKCTRNAKKAPTIMEESNLDTGAVCGAFQRTSPACTRGESPPARVSSKLVSGTGLHATPARAKILSTSVLSGEVCLGQERARANSSTRPSPTRSKALSSLNGHWLEEEPAETPESVRAETTTRYERCAGSRRTVDTGVPCSDGHASVSQQGNDVTNIDKFQDTGSRREGSCTLTPRRPNHRAMNELEKSSYSTMKEVSGSLESVVDEPPASAREHGGEWFDERALSPRSQRETSLMATHKLNEYAERSRTTTDKGSLAEGMAPRREHIASALDPYTPRQYFHRALRGGTTTYRDASEHEASPGGTSSRRSIQRRHHHKRPTSRSLCSTLASHAPLSQIGSTLASREPSSETGSTTSTMRSSELSHQLEVSRPASSIGLRFSSRQADGRESAAQSQRDQSPHPRVRSGAGMQKMRGFLSGMHASTKAVEEFAENLEGSTFSRSRRRANRDTRRDAKVYGPADYGQDPWYRPHRNLGLGPYQCCAQVRWNRV